jgi:hypothetical protein
MQTNIAFRVAFSTSLPHIAVVGAAHQPLAASAARVTRPYSKVLKMSKRRNKSQSVSVAAPVIVADVAELPPEVAVAEVAAEVAAPEAAVAEVAAVAVVAPVVKTKKYPKEGGKCWVVWNACDNLLASGTHPTVAHMRAAAAENNWNVSNASQEFYAWRKYHGRK